MIAIVNINSEKFTFNGIPYYKNFMGIVAGEYVHIVNVYDSKIALTKDGPVKYDEITVNGNSYASATLLQNALLPVLYTRNTLGGTGGGSQNLQQVTDNGNETDNDILINALKLFDTPNGDYGRVELNDGIYNFYNLANQLIFSFDTGTGSINVKDTSGFTFVIQASSGLTANRTFIVPNEDGTFATQEWANILIANVINQLINGAPEDANTLKELNDKIVALQAIVGGSDPDGNSIVDTVAELLAVFQTYPEGTDIATILAGKVNSSDIVNNLTQLIPGKILDASQDQL